ncbi:MAG: hypothetical protein J5I90_10560 [Caldilineales bacterium]|nr:hypothetical protein [Caldilineales bacterium]
MIDASRFGNRLHLWLILVVALVLAMLAGAQNGRLPEPWPVAELPPVPTTTVTATATPGWWDDVTLATPTLPKLPGLPRPGFQGVAGQEPGQKVAFQVVSCPTAGVRIADMRTAQPGWWQISGTASIPNLWYWKAEISVDGSHWANLVRAETAVVDGVLVRLNLSTVPAGAKQMRLTAVDRTGNYPEPCLVTVQ